MFKKNLFSKAFISVLLVALIALNGFVGLEGLQSFNTPVAEAAVENAPKYVFYFIGDGLGASQRQIAEYFKQEITKDKSAKLLMNTFPVAGVNTTHSADTLVTDSAAAGTSLAAGVKTNNGFISKLPNGKDVKTLVEAAEEKGMATGIISTTRLTHATPAAFASHNISRNNENEIAADFLDSGVDFFAGGGYRHFVPQNWQLGSSKRQDDRNIAEEFKDKGYKVFLTENEVKSFRDYKPAANERVIALLTSSHLPYEVDRMQNNETPSIAELTEKGIELLSQSNNGFFMMVEGGRIDHACHANDAVGSIHDTLAFDEAIEKAYEFYKKHPQETLIVVVGDHETGGMGLGFGKNYFLKMDELTDVKVSVEDILNNQRKYSGNRDEYFKFLEESFSLDNLNSQERSNIQKAMDLIDSGAEDKANVYGGYDPVAIAATHVLAERANVQFTTYAHSGTAIPMSAIGKGSEMFGGYKDNTEIAKAMANLMDFSLSQ